MIEHHQLGLSGLFGSTNLLELALTHVVFRGGRTTVTRNKRNGFSTRRAHELLEFMRVFDRLAVIHDNLHQDDTLAALVALKKMRAQGFNPACELE